MSGNIFQRYELKFLLSEGQRTRLERALSGRVIPDVHGESTICNLYYDTPDFRLIRQSQLKPVYKEKLRLRSYGRVTPEGDVFLELKKKYKGVVYKRRITLPEWEAMEVLRGRRHLDGYGQIGKEIDYALSYYRNLVPAVYLCYDRCAFTCRDEEQLRLTFDRNIRWRTCDFHLTSATGGQPILEKGQSLLEIKTPTSIPLWLVHLLEENGIQKASFSKYGTAYDTLLKEKLNGGIHCA